MLRYGLFGAPIAFRVAQGAEPMVDHHGDEIGHAEHVTRIRALWRNSGARPLRRAKLPGRGLAQQAVGVPPRIVEHAEAHPFEVGNTGASKRSVPTTPRGSKTPKPTS
jgi:hypothetical protein